MDKYEIFSGEVIEFVITMQEKYRLSERDATILIQSELILHLKYINEQNDKS